MAKNGDGAGNINNSGAKKSCLGIQGGIGQLIFVFSVLSCCLSSVSATGGEKAAFTTTPEVIPSDIRDHDFDTNSSNMIGNRTTHRQDLCGRYNQFRNRKIHLRDALRGLQSNVLFPNNLGFMYTPEYGIDPVYGGLGVDIVDELAKRAGFTWRNSFGWSLAPTTYNMTWTEQLWWGVNTYDIYLNRWDKSLERMDMGVAYLEPWYDASIILIEKREQDGWYHDASGPLALWNWARPFDANVWLLIIATILLSGLVYQFLEFNDGDRQDRSQAQWFNDNVYLSLLNFTQNFSYAPTSSATRLFSVSMAFWAMIVGATYTANLAGFMISQRQQAPTINSILEAINQEIPICTYANTNSDVVIKERYPNAIRVPFATEREMYESFHSGKCGLVADHTSSWYTKRLRKQFNPDCNLEVVEQQVADIKASFAIKADVGFKCTSLIRDVLDVHMKEMIAEGDIRKAWERYRARLRDNQCTFPPQDTGATSSGIMNAYAENGGSRRLQNNNRNANSQTADIGEGVGGSGEESLSVNEMAGTFILHFGLMFVAIVISLGTPYWERWKQSRGWAVPFPMELGLTNVRSYSVKRSSPTQTDGRLVNTNGFACTNQHFDHNPIAEDGLFRDKEQALPVIGEVDVDRKLEALLLQFERRQERKMDEHMQMVVMMLNEIRKQNKKFQKMALSDLGRNVTARPLSRGDSSNGRRASTASSDFGRYLRENLSSETY